MGKLEISEMFSQIGGVLYGGSELVYYIRHPDSELQGFLENVLSFFDKRGYFQAYPKDGASASNDETKACIFSKEMNHLLQLRPTGC